MRKDEKKNINKRSIIREMGMGALVLILTVLTYKFIAWNNWKVTEVVTVTKKILRSPGAVNLTITVGNKPLLQKAFAPNGKRNIYLIRAFGIAEVLKSGALGVTVNDDGHLDFALYRFKSFDILSVKEYAFIFVPESVGMDVFIRLNQLLPSIPRTLFFYKRHKQEEHGDMKVLKGEEREGGESRGKAKLTSLSQLAYLESEFIDVSYFHQK